MQLALRVCQQQAAFRKDLIDDDALDGSLACLPHLAPADWDLLLDCPCFNNCQLTPLGPSRPASRPPSGRNTNFCRHTRIAHFSGMFIELQAEHSLNKHLPDIHQPMHVSRMQHACDHSS